MPTVTRDRWLAINYAATIFTSAFLLFQVQPLVSKYILPWFGGSPAVWTTCLLFFQTLLFVGYAYAHFSHRRFQPRQQAIIHIALVVAAASVALFGVLPSASWEPRGQGDPVWQILLILVVSIGLPYFVLASTGPLLQAWFARSFPGRMPYRLYALSNVGSLLALVSYPFIFEPAFSLPWQAGIWSAGFIVYAVLCGYAAWRLWTSSRVAPTHDSGSQSRRGMSGARVRESRRDSPTGPPPRWTEPLLWLIWPAFASIVLMATTNHISADLAVMPFFWVMPLALYLLTFIVAFDRPAWYRPTIFAVLALAAIYGSALMRKNGFGAVDVLDCGTAGWMVGVISDAFTYGLADPVAREPRSFHIGPVKFLVVNFAAMFGICMLCHGELVRHRPDPRYLTSFYLMIAAGGALGGVFVTLAAPRLFATYAEWELSLFIAALLALAMILQAFVRFALQDDDAKQRRWQYLTVPAVALAVFLPAAIVLLDLTEYLLYTKEGIRAQVRNFFGTLTVDERNADDPLAHTFVLTHGVITHGAQFTHESRRREPTTYFSQLSGVGRTIDYFRARPQLGRMNVGGVGLGVGTLAAYPDEGDAITFYEINPACIELAESRRWFTLLHDARVRGADCAVRLGDARLTLRRELTSGSPPHLGEGLREGHPQKYHILVLDAFSGDSIPIHLLTAEAFEIYLPHLSTPANGGEEGAIAVHISNRYVDLEPVVRGIAEHFDLRRVQIKNDRDPDRMIYSSNWIILTRNESLVRALQPFATTDATALKPSILWTDTRSSLFDVVK